MKIAWITPTDEKSAIFEYSKIVLKELSKHINLTLFGTTKTVAGLNYDYYSIEEGLIIQKLKEFDLIIYNMGDNYNFHGKIFDIYLQIPGVIILHDLYYENFLNGYFSKLEKGEEIKKETIKHIKKYTTNKIDSDLLYNFFGDYSYANGLIQPMFEPIIANALGVITHCKEAHQIISQIYPHLSVEIALPFEKSSIKMKKIENSKVEITAVGYVNKEKRHDLVIKALSLDKELKNKVHYNIPGPFNKNSDYFKSLISMIKKFNLTDVVTFYGQVSKEKMQDIFSKTNIFINLRKPCLNTGSWSLVEEMASGKPVITEGFGFSRSLPDDVVLKLENNNSDNLSDKDEISLLSTIIKKISSSPKLGEECGKRAVKFIEENNSPKQYCKKLIEFAEKVVSNKSLKYQQEISTISSTYKSLVFTDSLTFKSFFNFSGIIKK